MAKFNSAKSSKLFSQVTGEAKNSERASKLSSRVKRRLKKNARLTGDELEFALSAADGEIAEKLKMGEPLDEFEKHRIDGVLQGKLR